jgi:hypothetical protein
MTEKEETVEREEADSGDREFDGREDPASPLGDSELFEREAERMVEIEARLRDEYDEATLSVHREGDVEAGDEPLTATVTGAHREGTDDDPERVVFTGVDDEDRKLEFSVPWPEDVTDESEPLVRLLGWYDLSVDQFASIIGEDVPLRLDDDGTVTVHVPPVPALGNDLWYRIKRWGMDKGLVTYNPGSLVRKGETSPYSASRLWVLVATTVSLLVGVLGLVVVPALATPSSAAAWLAYALLVGLPSGFVAGFGLLLLPLLVLVVGAQAYRWIRARFFPD